MCDKHACLFIWHFRVLDLGKMTKLSLKGAMKSLRNSIFSDWTELSIFHILDYMGNVTLLMVRNFLRIGLSVVKQRFNKFYIDFFLFVIFETLDWN